MRRLHRRSRRVRRQRPPLPSPVRTAGSRGARVKATIRAVVGVGLGFALVLGMLSASGATGTVPVAAVQTLQEANAALLDQLVRTHHLTAEQRTKIAAIFAGSPEIGQGNPTVTRHPMTPEACAAREKAAGLTFQNAENERICGGPYMVPLYDPATQSPEDAPACIDQLEFPDIPCAYPVVWVRAEEAEELCEAEGKRLCDAHEWEGGCAGELLAPDYRFDLAAGQSMLNAQSRMRAAHNAQYAKASSRVWSYGPTYETGVCGTDSTKSVGCDGGDWRTCGSNTYPTGAFPDCHSPLGVYDINGNAAEHMNLPLRADELASAGTESRAGAGNLGVTEMKGSWFIFDKYRAHEDWCRWRAPFWHGSRVMSDESHRNYHLGFRCCVSVPTAE